MTLQRFNNDCWGPFTAFPLKILEKKFPAVGVALGSLNPVIGGVL